jgi:hypothetical protein
LRRRTIAITSAVACLLLTAVVWRVGSIASPALAAQSSAPAKVVTTSTTHPPAIKAPDASALQPNMVAPPGSALYVAKRGDSIPSVARQFIKKTSYLTSVELADAIRAANADRHGNALRAGEYVIVPGILEAPIVEKSVPVARDFEVRAVYLTGVMASSEHGLRIIRRWRELGGNAVVFDIKDSDGIVNIPFEHPLNASNHRPYISDLPKLTHFLHSQGMHAIARVAIFRDERLVVSHPDLAVKSRRTGQPWRENGKLVWTDPSQIKVQNYDIALAKAAIAGGADEVQFDYVRFPAEGEQKDASFVFQKEHPTWHRTDVIADFLRHAYDEIHPTGVLLSLDVFGVMAWHREVDLAHTGQDIARMAKYCDVLSPMIYPSHFFGMEGYAHPGDAPEHFIGESMDKFQEITKGSSVVLRPWLQAFRWRTRTYSPKYIEAQVLTAKNKGGIGFLFWNANNDYSKPYAAMPEMRATKGMYFRGDEVSSSLRSALNPGTPSAAAPAAVPAP